MGNCIDYSRSCTADSDCLETGSCNQGHCDEPSWCSDYETTDYELDGVENFLIWFQGKVDFIKLAPDDDFTSLDETDPVVYPASGANSYLLSDILDIANVPYNSIKYSGGVIKVLINWECDIT